MARQVIVRTNPPSQRRRRVGEVAGESAAECAAVCCCCPCAVVNIMVLAVYKVPAGLFRKAMRKRERHRLLKEATNKKNDVVLLQPRRPSSVAADVAAEASTAAEVDCAAGKSEAVALEKEMWARFAGTGFWRSESQRQP